ncbi:MAG: DUF1244 domain-containing protein [Pseudomonadota bacterium]
MQQLDQATRQKLQAALFERLLAHLQKRTDIQNIDLMIAGGFCRNCFSKWLVEAADAAQIKMSLDEARELIYGMPYHLWKERYQCEATQEQQSAYAAQLAKSAGSLPSTK